MKIKKVINHLLLLLLLLFATPVQAANELEIELPEPLDGVQANLFYLGDYNEEGFVFFGEEWDELQDEGKDWLKEDFQKQANQNKIIALISKKNISPNEQAISNSSGAIHFLLAKPGNYAVLYDKYKKGNTFYQHRPSFFYYGSDGKISFQPKVDRTTENEICDLKVVALWFGDNLEVRPEEVNIHLYSVEGFQAARAAVAAENSLLETRTLYENTYWRTVFTDLDPAKEYIVIEEVPENYRIEVERVGDTIYLKNYYEEPDNPEEPGEPGEPKEPSNPENPVNQVEVPTIRMSHLPLIRQARETAAQIKSRAQKFLMINFQKLV